MKSALERFGACDGCGLHHLLAQIVPLGLEFLHAQDVRVLSLKPGEKSLGGGGSDAVQVGGDDSHDGLSAKGRWKMSLTGLAPSAAHYNAKDGSPKSWLGVQRLNRFFLNL